MNAFQRCAAALLLGMASAVVLAATDLASADELAAFQQRLARFPAAASTEAVSAWRAAQRLPQADPRRAIAAEKLLMVYTRAEEWPKALPLAQQLASRQREAQPADHTRLAMALGQLGTVLFALERADEADIVLAEQLQAWRRAHAADPLALARALENHAEVVEQGFGRRTAMIELLQQALALRAAEPKAQVGRHAMVLQLLATQLMLDQQLAPALHALARAEALLTAALARDPSQQEVRAGLVQLQVSRAGVAAAAGDWPQARQALAAAREQRLDDRLMRVEAAGLIEATESKLAELADRLDDAITAQHRLLELYERNQDLMQSGRLDPLLRADTAADLARLHLQQGDLVQAGLALELSRHIAGDSAPLLFLQADLESARGNTKAALAYYQAALRLRRESATESTVWFGTTRSGPKDAATSVRDFGGERGNEGLRLGQAEVMVPGGTFSPRAWLPVGAPTRNTALPVGSATDVERLLVRKLSELKQAEWSDSMAAAAAKASLNPRATLVFVHGFNVSFDDALKRAAQLRRDLNFDGPVAVFSWPSRGSIKHYFTDRSSAGLAVGDLLQFLRTLAAGNSRTLHLVAHSMGNRVLLPALARIAQDPDSPLRGRIGEVVMAAPAVPTDEFLRSIDLLAGAGWSHLTLYAAQSDQAMNFGALAEFGRLAGTTVDGKPLLHPALHSIDITRAAAPATVALNHDLFTANPVMNEDLRQLLRHGRGRLPHERVPFLCRRVAEPDRLPFWAYEPPTRKGQPPCP